MTSIKFSLTVAVVIGSVIPAALAQPVRLAAQCQINVTLTAAGSAPASQVVNSAADNRQKGCDTWQFTYSVNGFSSVTLTFQSAPDAGASPGTWVTYANQTVSLGSNPNTAASGSSAQLNLTGYNPWIRITLSAVSGSGSVIGSLYGWQS